MPLTILTFFMCFLVRIFAAESLPEELEKMDKELKQLNALTAEIYWNLSISGNPSLLNEASNLHEFRTLWLQSTCEKLLNLMFSSTDFDSPSLRATNLLCNGPNYTPNEAREISNILSELRSIYREATVCVEGKCMGIEPELMQFMSTSRDPELLKTVWKKWRDAVGPNSKLLYSKLVYFMNRAAQRAGYSDIGQCWRDELEIENLEEKVQDIYNEVLPLYEDLHAVVRYRLREHYGPDVVPEEGPIPAHILGGMWAQKWTPVLDIVFKKTDNESTLTKRLQKFQVNDMVERIEDYYVSLGFPALTNFFWENSCFSDCKGSCHGTAANMFRDGDYRVLYCAKVNEEDFHVFTHEIGHIQYFMAYKDLPAIFQDGATSAVQETIGEAVMMAMSTWSHMERLGLVLEEPYTKDRDVRELLNTALNLLPQISFSLAMDQWRWSVFRGEIAPEDYNAGWWAMRTGYGGVAPPLPRSEMDFDPASKFHMSDNTPYIRYFLASILQVQVLESMCKAAIYGDPHTTKSFPFPLHKCDLYGSKKSADALRLMMSKGRSIGWEEAVRIATGADFSTEPILRYFAPLRHWLREQILLHDIPVGWRSDSYDNDME